MLRKRLFIQNEEIQPDNYITVTFQNQNVQLLGNMFNEKQVDHIIADGSNIGVTKTYNFPTTSTHTVNIYMKKNSTSCESMFEGCVDLLTFDLSKFDMSQITSVKYMFKKCTALKIANISNANWSNVTTAMGIFSECNVLTSSTFTNVVSPKLTDMSWMFNNTDISKADLSGLDTSNVTTMNSLFKDDWYLNEFRLMSPVTKLTDTAGMFRGVIFGTFYYNKKYNYDKIQTPLFWSRQAV